MLEIWQYMILGVLGIATGWINVMAGGGSILTVPAMVFMGLPGPVANGTNRIAIIGQNIFSVWGFFSKGFADFKLSASLAAFAAFGAFFGAQAGVGLRGQSFNHVLVLVMVFILVSMFWPKSSEAKKALTNAQNARPVETNLSQLSRKRLVSGHLLMIGAGFWGGFIQIGVGLLLMPILHRVMGLDLVRTNMHKVFIALVFSIVALLVFAYEVEIAWRAGVALAATVNRSTSE